MRNFLRKLGFWQTLLLFLISLPITAYLLRQNNLRMVELTKKVISIDEGSNGDIKQIEPALDELRNFVWSHMNTTMQSPVQLQYRYNVVVDEIVAQKDQSDSEYRRDVYEKAQAKCTAQAQYLRVPCIQEYVASQPGVESLSLPPVEQFSYEYSAPSWSPDAAGFSVLISSVLGVTVLLLAIVDFGIPAIIASVKNDPLE